MIDILLSKGETDYLYQSGIPGLPIDEPSGKLILDAIREALQYITGYIQPKVIR